MTELGFLYSTNNKQKIFNVGKICLQEIFNQRGHFVVPTSIQKTRNLLTGSSTFAMKAIHLSTGRLKVMLKKAMELAELGFYKKKNGF
jgi:hypothetical protein